MPRKRKAEEEPSISAKATKKQAGKNDNFVLPIKTRTAHGTG